VTVDRETPLLLGLISIGDVRRWATDVHRQEASN
jgi:hypothetical protein